MICHLLYIKYSYNMNEKNIKEYFNNDYETSDIDGDLYVNEEGYIIGDYSDVKKNKEN